ADRDPRAPHRAAGVSVEHRHLHLVPVEVDTHLRRLRDDRRNSRCARDVPATRKKQRDQRRRGKPRRMTTASQAPPQASSGIASSSNGSSVPPDSWSTTWEKNLVMTTPSWNSPRRG